MNHATAWRLELATRIGAAYTRNPNAQVVMVAGSVGRGCADRFSDIEIDVYYSKPPTVVERISSVEACGGTVERLGEDEDEWEEQMTIGGFYAHTSTFLVATMERYLADVVDQYHTAPEAQTRLFSLQSGAILKGDRQVEGWRARAAAYPDGLRHAMLEENLSFGRIWYGGEMLAARVDLLSLYDVFVETGRRLLGALLGLNRVYLPAPDYLKSMDETVELLTIKPDGLSTRLKGAFHAEPAVAVRDLKALTLETISLVEAHVPDFDTAPCRAALEHRRRAWDTPPPELQLLDGSV
jgi:hypothetical protein